MHHFPLLIALVAGLLGGVGPMMPPSTVMAAEIRVSGDLGRAIARSKHGDILILPEGRYAATDLRIPHDLTLIGEGEAVIYSPVPVAKGLLVPTGGTDIVVRKLIFDGAVAPDKNGAGIRFEGTRLTVEDCVFRDNENGILATGDMTGSLIVRRSAFLRNGHGDGYSHGLYQYAGVTLEVTGSTFLGTREGHHIKTLASGVNVEGNTFDDLDGETSYVVDATGGGVLVVRGNTIYRRASASQRNIVNYDTTRRGELGSVEIIGNRVLTEKRFIELLRNTENAPANITGNEVDFQRQIKRGAEGLRMNLVPTASTSCPTPEKLLAPRETPRTKEAVEAPPADMTASFRRVDREGGFVTYGEVFEPGAVRRAQGLAVRVGDEVLPTQMNIKARHRDGSVRHAVVTVAVPEGRGRIDGRYELDPRVAESPVWKGSSFADLTMHITGSVGTHTMDVREALSEGAVWITGPLVEERMATVSAGPLLEVRLDGRQYSDGTGRLRLTFDNHKTFDPAPRELQYRVEVRRGDDLLFGQDIELHYRNSSWTAVLPLGHEPAAEPLPVLQRLVRSGALPPLQPGEKVYVRETTIPDGPVLPGHHGPLTAYMPTGGMRDEIGLTTNWTALWALSGEPAARELMLYTADIGLTIPWSFSDDKTGLPMSFDNWPDFWADPRGRDWLRPRFAETLFSGANGGWTPDVAHKPSLAYPAYLVTGEPVYLRALRHEATYALAGIYVETRGADRNLVTLDGQLRVVAWGLRSLGNAAFILPDSDPLKDYFTRLRDVNIAELHKRFVVDRVMRDAGDLEGYLETDSLFGNGYTFMLWQNDFVVLALAQETVRGTPKAREVLDWAANFVINRVLFIDDPSIYAAQDFNAGSPDGDRARSWDVAAAMTEATMPGRQFYVGDAAAGYSGLRAALGAIHHVTGNPEAMAALRKIHQETDEKLLYEIGNTGGRRWVVNFNLDPRID